VLGTRRASTLLANTPQKPHDAADAPSSIDTLAKITSYDTTQPENQPPSVRDPNKRRPRLHLRTPGRDGLRTDTSQQRHVETATTTAVNKIARRSKATTTTAFDARAAAQTNIDLPRHPVRLTHATAPAFASLDRMPGTHPKSHSDHHRDPGTNAPTIYLPFDSHCPSKTRFGPRWYPVWMAFTSLPMLPGSASRQKNSPATNAHIVVTSLLLGSFRPRYPAIILTAQCAISTRSPQCGPLFWPSHHRYLLSLYDDARRFLCSRPSVRLRKYMGPHLRQMRGRKDGNRVAPRSGV